MIDHTAGLSEIKAELVANSEKQKALRELLKKAGTDLKEARKGVKLAQNNEIDARDAFEKIKQEMKATKDDFNVISALLRAEHQYG